MRIRISPKTALLVSTGVLAAVAMTACTTGLTGATGGNPTTQPAAPPATVDTTIAAAPTQADTTPAATPPPAAVTAKTTRTPECRSSGLRLSLIGADAAMNHDFSVLKFTNVGKHSCVIVGFPGVSYVTGDRGTQVGAPAVREGKIGKQITLAPGQFASTVIDAVNAQVFDPAVCRLTPVRGYRIYPPDETASLFIPVRGQVFGCAGHTPDPQLTVVTIQPGLAVPTQY
ncbi:MAG TPA: DUF4232 domain-containing protein [Pseudonocardiaceae bacterium]|nr:DUF4232 domain-containing protein [Pseudonocardiaceae bacterium]